jgi:hypothetical protein
MAPGESDCKKNIGLTDNQSVQCRNGHAGPSTTTLAAFFPHRPHLSRRLAASGLLPPATITQSMAANVLDDPQSLQSTFTLQPNRRTSPPVRTCLVDIPAP